MVTPKKGTLCAFRISGYYILFLDIDAACTDVLKHAYTELGTAEDPCTFLTTYLTMTLREFEHLIADVGKVFKANIYTLTDIISFTRYALVYFEKRDAFKSLGGRDNTREESSVPINKTEQTYVYCLYNTLLKKCVFMKSKDESIKTLSKMQQLHEFEKIMQLPDHMSSVCDEAYNKIKTKLFDSKLTLCNELFTYLNHT